MALRHTNGNHLRAWTGAFLPETLALIARFTTPPTYARTVLINNLIGSLIAGGLWAKLDALYIMAAADSQAARQNWIANQYNLTPVSSPTFTADRGYAGDGLTSYLTTGYNPGAGGTKYVQDSAVQFIGINNGNAAENVSEIGARLTNTTQQSTILPRMVADITGFRPNQSTNTTFAGTTDARAVWMTRRSAASSISLFKNGTKLQDNTVASAALYSGEWFICGVNTAGLLGIPSSRRVWVAAGGQTLSDAEALAAWTAINTYGQAIGAA